MLSTLDEGAIEIDTSQSSRLSDDAAHRIGEEWKRRAAEEKGAASISGRIEATIGGRDVFDPSKLANDDRAGVAATIQATPTMQVLFSNTPGGWRSYADGSRVAVGPTPARKAAARWANTIAERPGAWSSHGVRRTSSTSGVRTYHGATVFTRMP